MDDVDLAPVARLVGDSSRAAMLSALLDDRALTVRELAAIAGIGAAAASEHLAKLLDGGLVAVVAQGRHRYFRVAGADVARALEALAAISPGRPTVTLRASASARALRPARLCYDHVAGVLGVRIHDHLLACGAIVIDTDGMALSPAGDAWFRDAGVDVASMPRGRRPPLRQCLDWTERRFHLAGALPAMLARQLLDNGWLRRRASGERGLTITASGAARLGQLLDTPPAELIA